MRSRCSARATSSRCTLSVSRSRSAVSSRSRPRRAPISPSRSARAALGLLATLRGTGQRVLEVGQRGLGCQRDLVRDGGLAGPPVATGLGPGPPLALLGGGAVQLVGAAGDGPDPLLAGTHGEAGLHLGLPGGAGGLLELVAQRGVGLGVVRAVRPESGGCVVALLELGEGGPVGVQLLDGGGDRALQPLGLAAGRAGLGAELAELLGDGGHPGVRLVQPVQRGLHVPGRERLLVQRGLQGEPEPLDPVAGLGQRASGVVDRGLHLEQARRGGRAAGGALAAEQVAVAR